MKPANPTALHALAAAIVLDLLRAAWVIVRAAARALAFGLLFGLACLLLTDAEKGEPQPPQTHVD